ncbi:UNVERIFIED_CONTAM: Serine/threonine-protein kinase MPS1 [Sesamum calycinum]|uniref:Serine/threonine-protein kinase MPS1 n=1 Tax=Sesamum calycinum TaxID=2727403 RepID=A0AAW2P5X9_9LAMI
MEGEPDLPAPAAEEKFFKPNPSHPININPDSIYLSRSFNTTSTCTSTASSSSSSPPDLVRQFQAAFKRHRPICTMQSNGIRPRRMLVPQQETSKESNMKPHSAIAAKKSKEDVLQGHRLMSSIRESKTTVSVTGDNQEDASITPPSEWGTTVNAHEENFKPCNDQRDQPGLSIRSRINDAVASSGVKPEKVLAEVRRKVHFSTEKIATSQGAHDRMATRTDDLLSHMDSLALAEMEWDVGNQVDTSAAANRDWQHHNFQRMEIDSRSEGGMSSLLTRRTMGFQDQLHQFGNFLQNDLSNAMTQSSVIGSSCVTSTLINSTAAPMISSTTYCSQPPTDVAHLGTEPAREAEVQLDVVQPSHSVSKHASGVLSHQLAATSQAISSIAAMPMEVNKSSAPSKELQSSLPQDYNTTKDSSHEGNNLVKGNVTDIKSQPPSAKAPQSDVKLENSKSEKQERGASGKATSTSRKKGYDPDLFFKVNGKLYQRLGKIGSGGSSEVHKVISSDCTIYALKKIKLRGRDYSTAYGFCQEIEYLNRLRGRTTLFSSLIMSKYSVFLFSKVSSHAELLYGGYSNSEDANTLGGVVETDLRNIRSYYQRDPVSTGNVKWKAMRLLPTLAIFFDCFDKTLLQEVMNGTMSIKDGRVKDDACIYMVLEYGEIDLAHMLAQKWKELDRSNATIDESWLRFYWQQILLAVNTIHEERIVHSDLKPANFLLVRGSLKLIDFGIAKAIMSDTTNIQRDSQVGTLSYMSPEAFMCNETDANGNTIKCGRPSDIWSLGCILYQMVYGRTPFSEYKTFWAKFKVITDPNHEIIYEPVSNPWLLDLMKKCLAWDRNERWRIPQLLQHPFLVPPVPPELPTSTDQVCTLFQLIAESSAEDQKVLNQVQKIRSVVQSESSISRDQLRKFLCEVSTVCFQLQEQLASL